jgi:hypothetical protein
VSRIAVIHLVRGANGEAPLLRFLQSYRERDAGIGHDLVLLMKGFASEQEAARYRALAEDVCARWVTVSDEGYDLGAYVSAARRLSDERLCFLNSYSVILADGWLAKLDAALREPNVGVAGATGSWASSNSMALNMLFLPNPYWGTLPSRRILRHEFRAMTLEGARVADRVAGEPVNGHSEVPPRTVGETVLAAVKALRTVPRQILGFPPFPAHHVRTNAFIIDRELFAGLDAGTIKSKTDAYALESGRHSFTRQVASLGLDAVIVDGDGESYEPHRWADSGVFWQEGQKRLLVADNQTQMYALGTMERRRMLSSLAWGTQARPEAPCGAADELCA